MDFTIEKAGFKFDVSIIETEEGEIDVMDVFYDGTANIFPIEEWKELEDAIEERFYAMSRGFN